MRHYPTYTTQQTKPLDQSRAGTLARSVAQSLARFRGETKLYKRNKMTSARKHTDRRQMNKELKSQQSAPIED